MKLLFDQNLSFKLCRLLVDLFPESNQIRLLDMETAEDRVIWEYAKANDFILVRRMLILQIWRRFSVRRRKSSGCDAATNPRTQSSSDYAIMRRL
jgi:hypothetical protein